MVLPTNLIKYITIGPCSSKEYIRLKINKYKESPEYMNYFIDFLNDEIGFIHEVREERAYYLDDDKRIIQDIKLYCHQKILTDVLGRTGRIKPFGGAKKNPKNNKSSRGPITFLVPPDEDTMEYTRDKLAARKLSIGEFKFYKTTDSASVKIYDPLDNKRAAPNITKVTKKSGFTTFRPSEQMLKRLKINKEAPSKKQTGYKPPSTHIDQGVTSIVIKNIPKTLSREYVNTKLKLLFDNYGSVNKINILNSKIVREELLGIAFVDFFRSSSVDKIIQSSNKFKLGHCILTVERKKPKV